MGTNGNYQGAKGGGSQLKILQHIQAMFGQDVFNVPKNATNTIYVEGIPIDSTEREVSRKYFQHMRRFITFLNFFVDIFRPFRGFKSVRLIPREISPDERVILCFADFENSFQTTLVINTLQGYRFNKEDILGLQFTYANKLGNQVHSHGQNKGEGAKDQNPTNNNNNSIANQTVHSGSAAGHSGAEASSTSKDGGMGVAGKTTSGNEQPGGHNSQGNNNNTSKNK